MKVTERFRATPEITACFQFYLYNENDTEHVELFETDLLLSPNTTVIENNVHTFLLLIISSYLIWIRVAASVVSTLSKRQQGSNPAWGLGCE